MPRWEAMVLGMSIAALAGWLAGKQEATPRTGFIELSVDPTDATVLVDDVKVSSGARVTVERRPGSYTVSVTRDGYTRSDQLVDVVAGGSTALRVTLEASPDTGFEMTSDPPGQRVWLDGVRMMVGNGNQARTPFRASRIKPGIHLLEIRGEGFKNWQTEVEIEPGAIRKVNAVMFPYR